MGTNSRLIGFILIISGVLVFLGGSAFSVVSSLEGSNYNIGGVILGILISLNRSNSPGRRGSLPADPEPF